MTTADPLAAFQVPWLTHVLSGSVERRPGLWKALANLESLTLREQMEQVPIDRPVYVAGLARAGTTILLELLARHPQVATHQYRDFPGQFVPAWWNKRVRQSTSIPRERAHGDGLVVTEHSPEAMEETLWMAFFNNLHNPERVNILDEKTSNPKFERFYRDHLRKLLLTRQKTRYVAKGNYNLTRFGYLQKLFPDARFVAVVRHPRNHIASLIKEQKLFHEGATKFPRALAHLRRVGHFEFGPDRRAINVGDGVAERVERLWRQGEEVRGTALYWASIYGWLADELERNQTLADATLVVRYEDLCEDPQRASGYLLRACELETSAEVTQFADTIRAPNYYEVNFSETDEQTIAEETAQVAERFCYPTSLCGAALAL